MQRDDDSRISIISNEGQIKPATFLLGIFSYSGGNARRNLIRETYLSLAGERYCILDDFIKQQSNYDQSERPCQIAYTFIIGGGGDHRPTDHDDSEPLTVSSDEKGNTEEDCTYLNIKENMEDGKSTTYMKFASTLAEEYGIDYVGKMDDDAILDPGLLMEFVNDELLPAPFNKRIYAGSVRLSVTKNHLYAAGEFYILSSDLAKWVGHEMHINARNEIMIHVEDLDMGSYVHSHPRPIKYINLNNFSPYFHPLKEEKDYLDFWDRHMNFLPPPATKLSWMHMCRPILRGDSL